MAYKSKVLSASDGGTGLSVAGASGNVLTSNGSAWVSQAPSSGLGYALQMETLSTGLGSLSDASTYTMSANFITSQLASFPGREMKPLYIPKAGTLNTCYGSIQVGGTLATSENTTVRIRLNGSASTNITSTLQLTSVFNNFSNTSLGISVAVGDYIEFQIVTPTWATNPTGVIFYATAYIT